MLRWLRLLLLLLLTAPVLAQSYGFGPDGKPLGKLGRDITAQLLFPAGTFFSYETIFPIVIEYENLTQQPQYFLLDWPSYGIKLPEEYRTVQLEPGGKKRLPLILPAQEAGKLYNLSVNKQSLSANLQGQSQFRITGLLSSNPENLDYLRSLQIERNPYYNSGNQDDQEYQVPGALSKIDAPVFPQHWGELSSLDMIIAYDLNTLNLGTSQLEALLRWVRNGGHLVLISNGIPNEFQGSPLEPYLPLEPQKVDTREERLTVEGPLRERGVRWNQNSLLSYRDLNYGRVWFLATPVLDTDTLGKSSTEAMWQHIFDEISPQKSNQRKVISSSVLDSVPELPRTQAGWVALFVLLYGLAVGPVNLSILRKKDKMLYAFVTVPLVAFLFAGGAYLVNRIVRPSKAVMREIGWIELKSGEKVGPAEAEQILFTPHPGKTQLSSDSTTSFDLARYNYRSRSRELGIYRVNAEGGLSSAVEMGTWDIQRLSTNSILELKEPITVDLSEDRKSVTVTTPYDSSGKSALIGSHSLGMNGPFELKAGTHTYPLEAKPAQLLSPSQNMTFDEELYPGRTSLQDQVWNQRASNGKGYLMFWTDGVATPFKVDIEDAVLRHDYFVMVEFEL